jgi:hypothetical protein
VRYRETCSTNRNLFKHSLRYGNLAKKVAKQPKIAERGQIHERTGVGDDQGLPDLASSFEFIDGLGVLDSPPERLADVSADSEGCRSAFRTDVDHDSEVMPISVPK